MQLGASNANYLQSGLLIDAPKCGQMHRLAASLYAHLYAHPPLHASTLISTG
jgi:hypothetical protein